MEKRTKSDIHRNAMVGIFLRLLEYYQGILFLTTNRVTDMDEAFFSRVSLGLHYEALTADTRKKIWATLLQDIKSEALCLNELAAHELNGRQIKHCIRLALSISHEEGRVLGQEDLIRMVEITKDFRKDFNSAT